MASKAVLGGAAAAGLAALAALAVFVAGPARQGGAEAPPAASTGALPARETITATPSTALPPVAAPAVREVMAANTDAPPEGLTAEQWRELRATLADHPQREAETARIVAYLQYSARWQNFAERRAAGASVSELKPVALALDGALDARVRQGELGGAEARAVKGALLEVIEPDPAARERRLRDWLAALEASQHGARAAERAAEQAQTREFERRQAEIVAAWRALPAAQRDAQRLEAELEALRRNVFTAPTREGDKR